MKYYIEIWDKVKWVLLGLIVLLFLAEAAKRLENKPDYLDVDPLKDLNFAYDDSTQTYPGFCEFMHLNSGRLLPNYGVYRNLIRSHAKKHGNTFDVFVDLSSTHPVREFCGVTSQWYYVGHAVDSSYYATTAATVVLPLKDSLLHYGHVFKVREHPDYGSFELSDIPENEKD